MPEAASAAPADPRGLARRLLAYTRPYRAAMAVSLALILVTTALVNALPVVLQRAIDTHLAPGAAAEAARLAGLTRAGGVYLALGALGFGLRLAQGLLTAWIGQAIVRDLRRDVFDKALDLGLSTYDRTPAGHLMTRVSSDVEAVQRFVTDGIVGLVADGVMVLGIAGYMIALNPRLAAATALLMPGLIFGLERVNRRLRRANREIRARQSDVNAVLQESLAGMTTIQLFNREAAARERFDRTNRGLRDAHFAEVRWFSHFFPLIELGHHGAVVLLIGVGGWLVLGGTEALTAGMLVAFLVYVRNLFWPLSDLSDKASTYQQAMAAAERIFDLFDTPGDVPVPAGAAPLARRPAEIRFENVAFAYEDERWVLRDFNLVIRRGESLAVVGATGAGKTTIISLLARFYDVQRGRILLDGRDLREVARADLRRRIGLVLQEPFLFAGTVAENIALGNPALDRTAVERAARHVNAHRFIERLPRGYDTELAGRGGGLSSGEKQLLALARALAQDPDIVLILDEATANVDTETEVLIRDALRRLMRERTTIAIAHRLSTIRDADRILVMQAGRVSAEGTHEELMAADGEYRRLYELLSITPGRLP